MLVSLGFGIKLSRLTWKAFKLFFRWKKKQHAEKKHTNHNIYAVFVWIATIYMGSFMRCLFAPNTIYTFRAREKYPCTTERHCRNLMGLWNPSRKHIHRKIHKSERANSLWKQHIVGICESVSQIVKWNGWDFTWYFAQAIVIRREIVLRLPCGMERWLRCMWHTVVRRVGWQCCQWCATCMMLIC